MSHRRWAQGEFTQDHSARQGYERIFFWFIHYKINK